MAIAPLFVFVLLGQAIAAGCDALEEVAGTNIVQRATRDAIRGRVFGAIGTLGLSANAVGFVFAGFVVQAVGARWTYGICAAVTATVTPLLTPVFASGKPEEGFVSVDVRV